MTSKELQDKLAIVVKLAGEVLNELIEKEPQKQPVIESVKCPDCGGEMISRTGKYGTFWGCKDYPKCKGTRDSMGRSREERDKEKVSFSDMNEVDNQNDKYRFRKQ